MHFSADLLACFRFMAGPRYCFVPKARAGDVDLWLFARSGRPLANFNVLRRLGGWSGQI
jgi:hypothetical protein